MGRIFISYSHANQKFVEQVNNYLIKNHFLTWFDKNEIKSSDYWDLHIKSGILCSDIVLIFYSKMYYFSPYCQKEMEIALSKEYSKKVFVVGLDEEINSLFLDININAIQRINFSYQKGTPEDLYNILKVNPDFLLCKTFLDEQSNSIRITDFFHGISLIKNPKHYSIISLLYRFADYILDNERAGKFISPTASSASLVIEENSNHNFSLKLIGNNDFTNDFNLSIRTNFLKKICYSLFSLSFFNFLDNVKDDLSFNSLFCLSNDELVDKVYSLFNSKINIAYQHLDDLALFESKLFEIYHASLFFENYLHGENKNYQVTPLVIKIATMIYSYNNHLQTSETLSCFPDIISEKDELYTTDDKIDSLTKIVSTMCDEDIFMYGSVGCGKSYLMINYLLNNEDCLYFDLAKIGKKFDNNLIKEGINSFDNIGYRLNAKDVINFSYYENSLILLLDNFDYLSEDIKNDVIDEIMQIKDVFRIVLFSSKRSIDNRISIDKSSFNGFSYYEILPLKKKNVLSFFASKGLKHGFLDEIKDLDEKDPFFSFFNNFTKLNIFYESIKNLDNFSLESFSNLSEIKIYQMIFESQNDFSLSKRISSLFNNTIVPINDVIIELVLDEISKIKEISYSNENEKLDSLRFKDFGCIYSILTKQDNHYIFSNEDIRSYFISSYIYSELNKIIDDFTKIESLLMPAKNNYNVLKYLSDFEILDVIDLDKLFSTSSSCYKELKLTLFKISQYNNHYRIRFSMISDIEEIPDNFFIGAENITQITIPKTTKKIGRAAFANMTRLKKINLTSNSEELVIMPWAFINLQNLEEIKIGNNYRQYRHPLISHCDNLKAIIIDEKNMHFKSIYNNQQLVSYDRKVLYLSLNSINGEVHVLDGIEVIEDNSLSYLNNIDSIYIPSSVKSISTNFSDFCPKLKKFTVSEKNPFFYSDDKGLLYRKNTEEKTLFRVPSGYEDDLKIDNDVVVIGSDSISCCSKIKSIEIPKSIKVIEDYAFADTSSLLFLKFQDIYSVKTIKNYIFLSTNPYLKIALEIEDEIVYYDVFNFNKNFNKSTLKQHSLLFEKCVINPELFNNKGFEIVSNCENKKMYSKATILRAINLFDNIFTYDENSYNILMIGMTEYNSINSLPLSEIKEYFDNLISSRHLSMIIFSRDLPLINQLLEYTNQISILRCSYGSTGATLKIYETLKSLEN